MKKGAIFLLIFFLSLNLSGQVNRSGTPVTKSFSMQEIEAAEYNWCIAKDKFGSVYFGNDDNAVIRYDGTRWTKIKVKQKTATIVRAIGTDDNGIVYVGGPNEFGYIEPDSSGNRVYVSVSENLKPSDVSRINSSPDTSSVTKTDNSDFAIGDIFSLIVKDTDVYFLSSRSLLIYNTITGKVSYLNLRSLNFRQFIRIYLIKDKIILTDNNKGLFEYKNGQILQLPGGSFFGSKMCLSILPYSGDQLIVGTHEDGVYLYNYVTGSVDSSFLDRKAFQKLKDTKLYCGLQLISGEIVYGTLRDGVFVFGNKGHLLGHWTSSNTEMQDNTVTALNAGINGDNELWISTNGFITKSYFNLPITQFSIKSGIDGGVNSLFKFNGSVYVGTDKGVYKSKQESDGSRTFIQVNEILDQVFPMVSATVKRDSFLLAGSSKGVYQIYPDGRVSVINHQRIVTEKEGERKEFEARSILQSKINPSKFYFGLNSLGVRIMEYSGSVWKQLSYIKGLLGSTLFLYELKNGDLIAMTNYPDGIFRIPENDTIPVKYSADKGVPDISLNNLAEIDGDLYASTGKGLYKYDPSGDRWNPSDELTNGYTRDKNVGLIFNDPDDDIWVSTTEERYQDILFSGLKENQVKFRGGTLSMLPNVKLLYISSIEGKTWLAKSKSILVIDKSKLRMKPPSVYTLLTKILISSRGADSLVMNETFYRVDPNGRRLPVSTNTDLKVPEFRYNYNSTSFFWTTPYMIDEDKILYSYKLEGYDKDWSKWDMISYKDYTNLPFGRYTFRIKARTATDIESTEATYSFIVLKPWYLKTIMIILYGIALMFIILAIIKAYTKKLKNENIRLEGIVAERTAVVVKQKEELEASIHYASRIQMALLPSETILKENIKNYFVLFKPRDIVSGDFYWMARRGDRLYIVAADCTGHGVPGAFMSLLGMSFLDEIIDKEVAPAANIVLKELRLHVTESLKQVGNENEAKDGMDMGLLVIDFSSGMVEFSGAYNPCFKVRKLTPTEAENWKEDANDIGEGTMSNGKYMLETILASKMPIGISSRMNEDFVFHLHPLEKGISYYLFSDGYIDQFGGPNGRKFMKKSFKRLILDIQDYPLSMQKQLLDDNLKEWKRSGPQIDDILVMGFRIE
jgi:hypothetical protein